MAEVVALERGVDRDRDGAEAKGGEDRHELLGAVLAQRGHPVAGPDTEGGQGAGHTVGLGHELGGGPRAAHHVEQLAVRVGLQPTLDQLVIVNSSRRVQASVVIGDHNMATSQNITYTVFGMERRSSGEQVAAHIRQLIFDGTLRQGDRIRQDDIAEELGVSRIPVREAIIGLDREGWVTIEPHRGSVRARPRRGSVRDHYELIGLTYGMAARRAVERAERGAGRRAGRAATRPQRHGRSRRVRSPERDVPPPAARHGELGSGDVGAAGDVEHRARQLLRARPCGHRHPAAGTAAMVKAIKAGDGAKADEEAVRLLRRQGDHVIEVLARQQMVVGA